MSDDEDIDFDPTQPSLAAAAKAGHPFSISWSREVRSILAGLDSRRLKDNGGPWVLESPFDIKESRLCAVVPDSLGEGGIASTGSYHDGLSTSSETSSEHLSASLGISVGYPFLNASVTAKYDRSVSEDRNGVKASRNGSCRVGRVLLDRTPTLSNEAIALLRSKEDGEERFRKKYGDFYICGFGLGADAGACLSASSEAKSSQETLEIKIEVEVLFYSETITHTETTTSHTKASSMYFSGYSTLDEYSPCSLELTGASASQQQVLRQRASDYLAKVRSLQLDVRELMAGLGLEDNAKLSLSDCTRLCKSGLVVELLLAPFARLNQYVGSSAASYS